MGRRPAEESSNDNTGGKLASATALNEMLQKLDQLHEVRSNNNADIRGVYDDVINRYPGEDRESLKIFYKSHKKEAAEQTKANVNRMRTKIGMLPIFAAAGLSEAA